jgi:ribosome-associated protein
MIKITDTIALKDDEIDLSYMLASGPGGQNVNKVYTAAQLRFDARRSPSLAADVKARLERAAGQRLTNEGVIVITAKRYRSQERNRADAVARLAALIARAARPPAPRQPTRPPQAEKQQRLAAKARRAELKSLRARPQALD